MSVNKPFYRIYRPGVHQDGFDNSSKGYEHDDHYLSRNEWASMLMSTRLIIDDFERLFEYIEPHSSHKKVFSHRIYELLLRTCTEIESCCKGILLSNKHAAKSMNDYKKLEQSSHLSGYTVKYTKWLPSEHITQPFNNWATGKSLPWYEAYNHVKHNRGQNFHLANLNNLLDAISGLICIIHSQIGDSVQQVFETNLYFSSNCPEVTVRSFTITPPQISDEEKYDFVWNDLKTDPQPFQCFKYV